MKMHLLLPGFVLALAWAISAPGATHYVDVNSTNATPPFIAWGTAATNIQQAVDAASAGDTVIVTDGVYAVSGAETFDSYGQSLGISRVAVTNAVTLQSVNGPQFTVVDGGGSNRCACLADGASLTGFTLTNGSAGSAGGVFCATTNGFLTNCVIVGNLAYTGGGAIQGTLCNCTLSSNSAQLDGGGALDSMLYNCTLSANSAREDGGGALYATLYNCVVSGNSALVGGGTYGCALYNCTLVGNSAGSVGGGASDGDPGTPCMLYNCIVYFNTAPIDANCYARFCTLSNCCITPLPACGAGNITNAPLFVDYANGNLRLQSNSPCINAGNNAYVTTTTDFDGNPRIVSGTVDIGAYEYQGIGSVISYAWLQYYGLPTDGSADFIDSDRDGMNNWQEWICGTNPTNVLSVLKMFSPSNTATGSPVISWESVNTRMYFLQRATNLTRFPAFSALQSNLVGQSSNTTYTDTTATNAGPYFYRVGVQ